MISNIQIDNNHEDSDVFIEQHHVVTIGRKSYITFAYLDWGSVRANVMIGRYTSIAHRVVFEIGLNHDHYSASTYPFRDYNWDKSICATDVNHYYEKNHYQIIIGNDVWIGEGVKILSGVHIGNGAVIGMGAVVTRDIPPYAIAVGNPAKVVKYRFDKDIIDKLEDIKWWNWDESVIKARLGEMQDPVEFTDKYYEEIVIHNSSLADDMDKMRQNGCKIFYFVADYDAPNPLWEKVVDSFVESYRYNHDQILIIEVPEITDESASSFLQKLDKAAAGCSGIQKMTGNRSVPSEFYYIDTYIVGNNIHSLAYIDAAESAGIEIESGCDWEYGLFEKSHDVYVQTGDDHVPLLSICIPTWNRSKYLSMTLESIVRQPEFKSGEVEVVISDNCSTDDTEAVGRGYAARYPNVRYFRNKKNITGRNFCLSLARGRGKLRKINNDTCIHSHGSLAYMCRMVRKYEPAKPVIYFGNMYTGEGDGDEVLDLEQFLVKESFHITWIGSFAIWGDECEGIADEFIDGEFLWQVRKLVSMIKAKGYVATCDKSCMAAMLSSKNYNAKWMWQVFHDDYLNIIRDYINNGEKEYIEKDLLFNHFGEISLMSERNPQNITLDEEYDDEISSHYKNKPYWDEFCKYYEDMMTMIRQQKNE